MHSTVLKEQKLRSVNIIQHCFYHEFELEQIAAVSTFFDCAAFMSVHAKESVHEAQFLFQNNEVFAVRFWINDTEKTNFISIIMTVFNCREINKPIMIRNNAYMGIAEGEGLVSYSPTTFIAVIFLELHMARKWKINGETATLIFVCIDQIFFALPL